VFAADEKAPDIGYFTCQQHHPENFWNPAFQQHPNGAATIAGIVMVSKNPEDHRHFISSFAGERHIDADATGISATTPRGVIQVMNPPAWRATAGTETPDLTRGAHLAAIRFVVRDMAAAMSALKSSGIAATDRNGSVVVPPHGAHGATLIFETSKQG
jgi:hypothetical protein